MDDRLDEGVALLLPIPLIDQEEVREGVEDGDGDMEDVEEVEKSPDALRVGEFDFKIDEDVVGESVGVVDKVRVTDKLAEEVVDIERVTLKLLVGDKLMDGVAEVEPDKLEVLLPVFV